MVGDLVYPTGTNGSSRVYRIISIDASDNGRVEYTVKPATPLVGGTTEFPASTYSVGEIYLTDDFFNSNGYHLENVRIDGLKETSSFVRDDYYGPAITRTNVRAGYNSGIEYSIAGIIIRSVSDFQDLMRLCCCEKIADSVNV